MKSSPRRALERRSVCRRQDSVAGSRPDEPPCALRDVSRGDYGLTRCLAEDARVPNPRDLLHVQRRLPQPKIEALVAGYEADGRVGELVPIYGIHCTTVSAHVSRAGKTRSRAGVI